MKEYLLSKPKCSSNQKGKPGLFRRKMLTTSFQQFYEAKSKQFSINYNLKGVKMSSNSFIDQQIVDVIDEQTNKKRMSQFIKRKVPVSVKARTQPIQSFKGSSCPQDKRRLRIYSMTFKRERNKVLSKFQTSRQLRQDLFRKLGIKKPEPKPFFQMERGHIHSFEDRYRQLFKQYNSRQRNKQKNKKSLNKVHPFCEIYDSESKKVIKNYSFEKKCKVNYQPFGKIDYSAHY